ncbi:ABC transporter substrate-binding protein [Bosea sp. PAMC 26642]|uniref:ABC transporter substrate-binding protein n=1 Tax=Bosea sp. (strain PAMC 26642) TaxID=1792307 RepID=UPI0007700C92|nr:sugar ABC transporter substrate-binding protein [Bosea sp. PAMC 26642]AMJ62561.1 ABC transporter substrate-binding protein [Bosea sp. PAMC 26642]
MSSEILKPTRRVLLRNAAMLGALSTIAAPAIIREANAQSSFNWKRFAGTKLDVMMVKNPRSDLMQSEEKAFTALTGIEVSSEQVPEQQQRQKAMIEFSAGKPAFDVTMLALHVQKRLSAKGKWMEDLRPYMADASLTSPDFDYADFAPGAVDFGKQADGSIDTLPHFIDFWMVYYNKEMFAQKGIEYPKTMDELVVAAGKLHDPAKGVAGFVSRGLKNANIPVWTSWLLGQGLETVSATGKLQTDGPEAIWAADMYRKLNKDYGPAGVVGFNWNECQTTFMQGRAAMWLDGIGFATPLEDATKSRIVGKVGYGVTPAGPKAHHSALFGDGLGIARSSKNKQAAWLYLQYMCNKGNQLAMIKAGAGAPGRLSALSSPEASAGSRFPKQYFECLAESGKIARAGLPQIIPVTEFRDVFGVAITNTLTGGDSATELKKATETFKPILEKSEQA